MLQAVIANYLLEDNRLIFIDDLRAEVVFDNLFISMLFALGATGVNAVAAGAAGAAGAG